MYFIYCLHLLFITLIIILYMHNKTRNVFCTDKSQLLKYCLAHSRCLINIVEQLHLPFNMCAFLRARECLKAWAENKDPMSCSSIICLPFQDTLFSTFQKKDVADNTGAPPIFPSYSPFSTHLQFPTASTSNSLTEDFPWPQRCTLPHTAGEKCQGVPEGT